VVSFSPSLKARRADGANARLRIGEDKIPTWVMRQKKGQIPLFCSIQTLNRLGDAHTPWGGPSAFLNPLIQSLISARNVFTDALSKNVCLFWPPHDPVKLTYKINYHK
jgi:hypothetical protein